MPVFVNIVDMVEIPYNMNIRTYVRKGFPNVERRLRKLL